MLRSQKRTFSRYDPLAKLNQQEVTSGKIIPSRVRSMHTTHITVLPDLDAPAVPQDLAAGIGYYLVTADVTGDGPPLYYTIFFNRVPLSPPFQLS